MMKHGKVWGETAPLLMTPFVEVHVIHAEAGYHCSWHSHAHKWNAFYVVSGALEIQARKRDYPLEDKTTLGAGEMTTIPPGEEHRFWTDCGAVVLEVYYPEPLGATDIKRSDAGGEND